MFIDMTKRKAATFRLDERLIDALDNAAADDNNSRNRFLEKLLITALKELKKIPEDFIPMGENRGGDQKSSKN